jgi:hypothetical protein
LIRILFALMGGVAGALIGGMVIAMIAAQVLSRTPDNIHAGWTIMAGAEMAGLAGLLLGAIVGIWLVLRDTGRRAGTALTALWVIALLLIGSLGFVAFS